MKWKLSTPELRLVVRCLGDALAAGALEYAGLHAEALTLLQLEGERRADRASRLAAKKRGAATAFHTAMRRTGHKGQG